MINISKEIVKELRLKNFITDSHHVLGVQAFNEDRLEFSKFDKNFIITNSPRE